MGRTMILVGLAVSCVTVPGCRFIDDMGGDAGSWSIRQSVFDTSMGQPVLLSTETVTVGEPLSVTVRSVGDACIRSAGVEVETVGLVASLAPQDSVYLTGENEACTAEFRIILHNTVLSFHRTGTASIIVRGRDFAGEPVEITRSVPVID